MKLPHIGPNTILPIVLLLLTSVNVKEGSRLSMNTEQEKTIQNIKLHLVVGFFVKVNSF